MFLAAYRLLTSLKRVFPYSFEGILFILFPFTEWNESTKTEGTMHNISTPGKQISASVSKNVTSNKTKKNLAGKKSQGYVVTKLNRFKW